MDALKGRFKPIQKSPNFLEDFIKDEWRNVGLSNRAELFEKFIKYLGKLENDGLQEKCSYQIRNCLEEMFCVQQMDVLRVSIAFPVYMYFIGKVLNNRNKTFNFDDTFVLSRLKKFLSVFSIALADNPERAAETLSQLTAAIGEESTKELGRMCLTNLTKADGRLHLHEEDYFMLVAISHIILVSLDTSDLKQTHIDLLPTSAECIDIKQWNEVQLNGLISALKFQSQLRRCTFSPRHLYMLLSAVIRVCKLDDLRIIVERLPYPLMGEWKTEFLKSFFLPLSYDYVKCVKSHDIEVTIVANKRWTGIVSEVHNLLVAAQNFITRNGCSENLSTSSSNWVSLVPRTIKFVEIQPSHVEEMRFLFGTEEFVKNCKAEIHDTFLLMIKKNYAAIEPRSFIALIELLETYKLVDSAVFEKYLRSFNDKHVITDYNIVIEKLIQRDPNRALSCVLYIFEEASKLFRVGDSAVRPVIYSHLLGFRLDKLLDVPEAETLLFKFMNDLVKNTSEELSEHLITFMDKPTWKNDDRLQSLICLVLIKHLPSNRRSQWFSSDLIYKAHELLMKVDVGFNEDSPGFGLICGILCKICIWFQNNDITEWRKVIQIKETLSLVRAINVLVRNGGKFKSPEANVCIRFFKSIQEMFKILDKDVKEKNVTLQYVEVLEDSGKQKAIQQISELVGVPDILQNLLSLLKEFQEVKQRLQELLIVHYQVDHQHFISDILMNVLITYQLLLPSDLIESIKNTYNNVQKLSQERGNKIISLPALRQTNDKSILSFVSMCTKLETFLGPLQKNIKYLLAFEYLKSKYVTLLMTREMKDTTALSLAVDDCLKTVQHAIVDGSFCLNQMYLNITSQSEMQRLANFVKKEFSGSYQQYGMDGFIALQSMEHFRALTTSLSELFFKFGIEKCCSSSTFIKLSDDCKELETPELIPLRHAVDIQISLHEIFPRTSERCEELLQLFKELTLAEPYVKFCKRIGFGGEIGKRLFLNRYNFILQEIHNFTEQHAVDALWMAYNTIFLFIDDDMDFNMFCRSMQSLGNIHKKITQVRTLCQQNLGLLEECFTRDEMENKEKMSKKLSEIFENHFIQYDLKFGVKMRVFKLIEDVEEPWELSDVSEFNGKLELIKLDLVDEDIELLYKIRNFEEIYQTSCEACNLLKSLKQIGHFDYQKCDDPSAYRFPFNTSHGIPIEKMRTNLNSWKSETVEKRLKHPVLSFFSNFKVLKLYDMMINGKKGFLRNELCGSLLFADGVDSQKESTIKDIVAKLNLVNYKSEDHFESVGMFLTDFKQAFDKRQSVEPLVFNQRQSSAFRLYMVQDPTPEKMYTSALMLLKYSPLAFQVLHCSHLTTLEIIVLFFTQLKHNSVYSYVIIGVNTLSNALQEVIINECLGLQEFERSQGIHFDISFVESGPSLLRTMPWCYQDNITPNFKSCQMDKVTCHLIHGLAGNGKTYYIQKQLKAETLKGMCTFSVNEDFQHVMVGFISKLSELLNKTKDILIYLNFTLPYTEEYCLNEAEREAVKETCNLANWFFSGLLVLGYIEDPSSATSFSLNQINSLEIFVEVPVVKESQDCSNTKLITTQLELFYEHFPVFKFVGQGIVVPLEKDMFECTREEEKLTCKYLKAEKENKLDKLHEGGWFSFFWKDEGIGFKDDKDLTPRESSNLLLNTMPVKIKERKIYQKLFVSYLSCRCEFLEDSVYLRFYKGSIDNEPEGGWFYEWFKNWKSPSPKQKDEHCHGDPKKLRSQLLNLMKQEVIETCVPRKGTGYSPPHLQLIYDHDLKNFTFLHNGDVEISDEENDIVGTFKFHLPSRNTLREKQKLESYLYNALKIPADNRDILKKAGYVLTLDYLQKILSVHERLKSGMPVIISGETGVGKTFLFETMSKLYNGAYIESFEIWRENFSKKHLKTSKSVKDIDDLHQTEINTLQKTIKAGDFKEKVKKYLAYLEEPLLFPPDQFSHQAIRHFLKAFIFGKVKQLFYVLKVHPGLKPTAIRDFLQPIIRNEIDRAEIAHYKVMVFFDEINTSSCLGFLKEIVVDHCIDGVKLPESLFIVAACNPHRGNCVMTSDNIITDADAEQWFKGSYIVHPMMPSFSLLMWDFGSLNESQEEDYILAKLAIMDSTASDINTEILKGKIALSQNLMREYTEDYIKQQKRRHSDHPRGISKEEKLASSSVVSQRDIQRVLKIYTWFKRSLKALRAHNYAQDFGDLNDLSMRSLYLSLALVYYFRLNKVYRERYAISISDTKFDFLKILHSELEWWMGHLSIPPGIADTQALRENLYTMIICIVNCIPLIITGPPGTSKTLSFKIVEANMKGDVSPMPLFKETIFGSITPHIYQCSKHSTPSDIDDVFDKAKTKKQQICDTGDNGISVVFLDEAGLPNDNLQVLKVLHYHLDNPEVPFIALTNRVLDAAKSNRAICLFQVNTTQGDINKLAMANISLKAGAANLDQDVWNSLSKISTVFYNEMLRPEFNAIFGLRDIMHLFSFIRKHMADLSFIEPGILVRGIQRNFSGSEDFNAIAKRFTSALEFQESVLDQKYPSPVATLRESLTDKPEDLSFENEVRYKLLIDSSEDESLISYLFKFGLLQRADTKVFVSSHLKKDRLRKMIYLTKIRNSITQGHTIVIDQFDDIHESLYDLFNQRFTCFEDSSDKTKKYYTRIAIGSRYSHCLVNPSFQCIVILKKSSLADTPAPFLNRFEKFHFDHLSFRDELLTYNSPFVKLLLTAVDKVHVLIKGIPSPGIFGGTEHSVLSLALTHIATPSETGDKSLTLLATHSGDPIENVLMQYVDFKEGMLQSEDQNLLHVFEDLCCEEDSILYDSEVSITRMTIEETFNALVKMETLNNDEECIVAEGVDQILLILLNYLVVQLMRDVTQLIPPEVFVAIKEKIPERYTHIYLNQQAHFSLQDLVSILPNDFTKSRLNKTFCYCRYSPHEIPDVYFPLDKDEGFVASEWNKLTATLPEIKDRNSICALKIRPDMHGDYIYKKVKHFLEFDNYDLLIIYCNSKLVSKETINYTRLVIEDLEWENKIYKKIVLIMMFPSELFFEHFYPSHYLDGWNHYYLDSIAPAINEWSINLKDCFQFSLLKDESESAHLSREIFRKLYISEVPVVCASFISLPTYDTRYKDLNTLVPLLSLGDNHWIGNVLFQKFCKQWTSRRMQQILHQAASTQNCKISMTDSVDMLVKFKFRDFIVYMLTYLKKSGALDALFDETKRAVFLQLICSQIEKCIIPENPAQIKLDITTMQNAEVESSVFPFFQQIHDVIERYVRSVRKKDLQFISEFSFDRWVAINKSFSGETLLKLDDCPQLWEYYLLTFLSLFYDGVTIQSQLFCHFSDEASIHCSSDSFVNKLVWLHFHFATVPRNALSILTLELGSKSFSGRELVEFFMDKKTIAEKLIDEFFDIVSNNCIKTANESDDSQSVLKKFTQDSMEDILEVDDLSPVSVFKKTAMLVYYEMSLENMPCADNFLRLILDQMQHFDLEVGGVPYFVNKCTHVMTQCKDLEEFLNLRMRSRLFIPINSIRTILYNILHRLLSERDANTHQEWLHNVLNHADAQRLMSHSCTANDRLFTPCFLYQMFSLVMKGKSEVMIKSNVPYIPFFYQKSSRSDIKCSKKLFLSLYFLRKLRTRSQSSTKQYSELVKNYQELIAADDSDPVEIQVVMQELIESVAVNIVESKPMIMAKLNDVFNRCNFQDQNGIMLLYQIWKKSHSFSKLKKLVSSENSSSKDIDFIESIRTSFVEEEKYFERVRLIDVEEIFASNFDEAQNICKELTTIFAGSSEDILQRVTTLVRKRCSNVTSGEKQLLLVCLLFTFFELFYRKKNQRPDTSILQTKLKDYLPDKKLKICFLFVGGGNEELSNFEDELQTCFTSSNTSDDEKEMWQAVVMIVGAVLASRNESCHLYSHLFEPNSIDYIPGATVPGICKDKETFYENLMDMEDNGFFLSKQSYDYVTRGTMSLPCLYFTQFANFACLCVHFLKYSKTAQYDRFYKSIWFARDECFRGLKRSWKILINRLNITAEERLLLIEKCVCNIMTAQCGEFRSIKDQESLDAYEIVLDTKVFRPSWEYMIKKREALRDKVIRESRNSIQSNMITLERCCPVSADKWSFLTFILSSTSLSSKHFALKHFVLMRPLLDAIARNLYMFVDFYLWLHDVMAMTHSRADAHCVTLNKSLTTLKESGKCEPERLEQEKMIYDFTKLYRQSLFSKQDMRPCITEDTVLYDVITISQPRFFGLLHVYIERMVQVYNGFLREVKQSDGDIDVKRLQPFTPEPIQRVQDIDDMMDLIDQGCCVLPSCNNISATEDLTLVKDVTAQVYDLDRIQSSVQTKYFSTMKQLKDPMTVYWVFKDEKESVTDLFIEHSIDLDNIEEGIPASYREDPDQAFTKELEFRCHSLSYFKLLHITMGLRIAVLYLAKALSDKKLAALNRHNEFEKWTLPEFLKIYTARNDKHSTIIQEVLFIDTQKLDLSQNTALQELKMRNILKALRTFVHWLQVGMYEYSSFPYSVKEDIKISTWPKYMEELKCGNIRKACDKIRSFRLQLSKCDSSIRKLANEKNVLTLSLIKHVPKSLSEDEIFHQFPGITVSNYVKFSILLQQAEMQLSDSLSVDLANDSIASWTDEVHENTVRTVLNINVDNPISRKNQKDLADLTTKEVVAFMETHCFNEEYIEGTKKSEITGQDILENNDRTQMRLMGMAGDPLAYFQFKVFIKREYSSSPSRISCSVQKVVDFCRKHPDLRDIVDNIKTYQIDGEMLLELVENDLMLKKLTGFPDRVKKNVQTEFKNFCC